MSDKKWPKCQTTAPENLWAERSQQVPEQVGLWAATSIEPDADLPLVKYTRTDIAEARIAELEATIDRLQSRWANNEPAAKYKAERDALRARIDDAPRGRVAIGDNFVQPLDVLPREMRGKVVALVALGDDDG